MKVILEKHPWIKDVEETMKLLEEEERKKLEMTDPYGTAFEQGGELEDEE